MGDNLSIFNFNFQQMTTTTKVIRILSFILLLIILDHSIGILLNRLYFSQKGTVNARFTYSLFNSKEDVIIYGSSRAICHYNPQIISDSLHMSCYNAGRDGGYGILIQAAQISSLLEYHIPKIIIIEFDFIYMDYRAIDYQKLNILLPYANLNQNINELIELRSPYEKFKMLSKIYPFNSDIINIIRYNISAKKSRLNEVGYYPVASQNKIISTDKNYPYVICPILDENKFKALEQIITLCKTKKIALIFINSPIFRGDELVENKQSIASDKAIRLLNENKIPYLDFSNDTTISKHMEYFYDIGHLNEIGANIFSRMVVSQIKKIATEYGII
jgi:hypothetical protein